MFLNSNKISEFVKMADTFLTGNVVSKEEAADLSAAMAFGLLESIRNGYVRISEKGKQFFKWMILNESERSVN